MTTQPESDFIVRGSSPFTAEDASAFKNVKDAIVGFLGIDASSGPEPERVGLEEVMSLFIKRHPPKPGRPRLHRKEDIPEVKRQTARLHYYRNREKAIEMKRAYYNANRDSILAKKRRAYHLKKSAEKETKQG